MVRAVVKGRNPGGFWRNCSSLFMVVWRESLECSSRLPGEEDRTVHQHRDGGVPQKRKQAQKVAVTPEIDPSNFTMASYSTACRGPTRGPTRNKLKQQNDRLVIAWSERQDAVRLVLRMIYEW